MPKRASHATTSTFVKCQDLTPCSPLIDDPGISTPRTVVNALHGNSVRTAPGKGRAGGRRCGIVHSSATLLRARTGWWRSAPGTRAVPYALTVTHPTNRRVR